MTRIMTPAVRLHHFRYGKLENFKRLIFVVKSVQAVHTEWLSMQRQGFRAPACF
jgi:hypothetical protein